MYVTTRSRMISIMDLIGPELSELFALEFAKIAVSDFVYSLTSINVDQLVPNMVTTFMNMRSWMSLIMVQSDSNIWRYLPFNKANLFNLTFFLHPSIYK